MYIPEKIKVGGIDYMIKFVDNPSEEDFNIDGAHSSSKQEILIKKCMGQDYTNATLLHEIFHAVFYHCGLEQDESVIERLAHCFYQVLKDNNIDFKEAI